MVRTQVNALIDSLWAAYKDCAETVGQVSNTQLDAQVPSFGGRTTTLRNMVYQSVWQPREHSIHVEKILQVTRAPGAQPTEAQAVLSQAAEALGLFVGLLSRLSDEDLDRSFEDQTPRKVAEHIRSTIRNSQDRAKAVLEGKTAGS